MDISPNSSISAIKSLQHRIRRPRFLGLPLKHRQLPPQILLLHLQLLQLPHHLFQLVRIHLNHRRLGSRLRLIDLGFDAVGHIIYASFMQFLFAEPFGGHTHIGVFTSIVIAIFFDEVDGGILQNQWFFILMRGPGFSVFVMLSVWMFECVALGVLVLGVCCDFEVHGGGVRFVIGVEGLVFGFLVGGRSVQVYHR